MNDGLGMMDILCVVFSVIAIGMGILEIKDKRLVGKRMEEYTEESVKEFAPIEGIIYLIIGVGGVVMSLAGFGVFPFAIYWPGMIIIFGGIVADAILIKKKLVPKDKNKLPNQDKYMLK